MLTHRFAIALTTAHDLHATQLRKGTRIPYVSHLLGVASLALQHGATLAYGRFRFPDDTDLVRAFLQRAIAWFAARDIPCHRVLTDNGSGYVSRAFGDACAQLGLDHRRTRPYTPRTNGKAERSIQTLLREWPTRSRMPPRR